jgi:glycosyltransferase involved in cell wall biosynthesis
VFQHVKAARFEIVSLSRSPATRQTRYAAASSVVGATRARGRLAEVDVSLVMSAYAPRADWLRTAVASALVQSGCSCELVVVDDGSPEPVADMLDDVEDPRLRVLRVDHRGLSATRNVGVAASSGRYLRFIDADDVFPADSTARLLRLAWSSSDIVACGATRQCTEDLEPIWDRRVTWRGDPLRALLLMRCTITPPAAMLVPRSLADEVGPWRTDLVVANDLDYQVRLLEHGRLVATKRVVVWYRRHADSLSWDAPVAARDCVRLVQAYFARHPTHRGTRLERQAHAALELLTAELEHWPQGPWRDRRFWRALLRDPTAAAYVYETQMNPRLSRVRMLAKLATRRTAAR